MVKAGDTVLLEDSGALILVIEYANGVIWQHGIRDEEHGRELHRAATLNSNRGEIKQAYTATRQAV